MRKHARQTVATPISTARWTAYAAAGAATVLAGASSVEAEIHYSGVINQKVVGTSVKFPLQAGASLGFSQFIDAQSKGDVHVFVAGSRSALIADEYFKYGGLYADRLRPGAAVSRQGFAQSCSTNSSSTRVCFGARASVAGADDALWNSGGQGFIGFLFHPGSGTAYGWARIKVGPAPAYQLVVVDYAWADAGEKIKTGQTRAKTEPVPNQGSLALLALGAAGVAAWRRRRGPGTKA